MAHLWQGIVAEYSSRLPIVAGMDKVSLGEGGTPLLFAKSLSHITGSEVYVKVEGMNPTGSFKDRGMSVALTFAAGNNFQTVVCASTGNTSASAAAYAQKAGLKCAVLVPEGKISLGKLSQALIHGADLLQISGNFDKCLDIVRDLAQDYPIFLANSVTPARIEGQKTGSFEIVDVLGRAPDIHILPVGNAGNITAYWRGYLEYFREYQTISGEVLSPRISVLPKMWGFQAAGAAPIVSGFPVEYPETAATAIRIGNPASWEGAVTARDDSGGMIAAVTDQEILAAQKILAQNEGIFVEPASAAGVAGLLQQHAAGNVEKGQVIVIVVTGHGLKDTQIVFDSQRSVGYEIKNVASTSEAVAESLGL